MKEITGYWSNCDDGFGSVVDKVEIFDEDVIKACGKKAVMAWNVPQAKCIFNAILKKFGYEITRIERWSGDRYWQHR